MTHNGEQIEAWNGRIGERWTRRQTDIDAMLAPFGAVLLQAAAVPTGARVLDIGCGAGDTSLALAQAVGSTGFVTGVDVSTPLLTLARQRVQALNLSHVHFEQADASVHSFTPGSVDHLVSRFGVMFFADPTAAFRNLRIALKPEGTLSFVCWQAVAENPWVTVPLETVRPLLPPPDPATKPDPNAPGPFAFADASRVKRILSDAGFSAVHIEPVATTIALGANVSQAVGLVRELGPTAGLLAEAGEEVQAEATQRLHQALSAYVQRDGVRLRAVGWCVTARTTSIG